MSFYKIESETFHPHCFYVKNDCEILEMNERIFIEQIANSILNNTYKKYSDTLHKIITNFLKSDRSKFTDNDVKHEIEVARDNGIAYFIKKYKVEFGKVINDFKCDNKIQIVDIPDDKIIIPAVSYGEYIRFKKNMKN